MTIQRLDQRHARRTRQLVDDLRISLFGVESARLHAMLVADSIAGAIDCRIAVESEDVRGIVLASPAAYWWRAPARHWVVAAECVLARLGTRTVATRAPDASSPVPPAADLDAGTPERTWQETGDAWRVIFVGTAPAYRGRGIAAQLYQSLMRDRSLVARIARDNLASIRLHRSLGWRLYPDGAVVLAVHVREQVEPDQSAVARAAAPGRTA